MALTRPTLTALIERIVADFKTSFGATYIALRSFLMVFARVIGGSIHLLYGYLANIVDELFVMTASTVYLERIGSEYGILRKAAVATTGTTTITGTPAKVIPANTELQSANENSYVTDSEVTIEAGGTVDADVTASVAGIDSNETAAAVLTFVTPIAGVNTSTIVDGNGLTGGTDEETDENYRSRILSRKRFAPQGGCGEDYISWAKEIAGVTRAWIYEQYQGRGTLALFFMRDDDTDPFPGTDDIATVRTHIISHEDSRGVDVGCPVTANPGLFVMAPIKKEINMSISIYPNTVTVQTQIEAELEDLFYRESGPGETVYLSEVNEAISLAKDEEHHNVTVPASDIVCAYNEVAILGTVSWSDY